eukprot:jgi/Orpsp1_1/1176852/evm.model.c7180000059273.1
MIKTMDTKNSVTLSHSLTQSPTKGENSKIVTIINKIKKCKSNTRIKSNKEIINMISSNKFINIGYIDNSESGNGRTPLIYAVQRKNFELSKFLVCYNTVNTSLILHFIFNIKYGKSLSNKELNFISKNCIIKSDINYQDANGNTALLYACKLNNKKIIELLLKHGANTNIVNNKNKSPLMYSCKNGNKSCVDMLLKCSAKLDIETYDDGKTAFKYACGSGKLPVIKTLIQHKAINNKFNYSDAFNYAPQNELFDDVYNILQSYTEICLNDFEYSLSPEEEKEHMELIRQCIQGNLEQIKAILSNFEANNIINSNIKKEPYYLDVNFKDKHGYTALMWASYLGHTEIVHELIYRGKANVNIKSDIEESAILLACEKGFVETAKILLENGANVNDTNYHEDTLLMIACLKGNIELTRLLLENNADVNAQNKSNDSALIYAVERNQEECVQLLLEHHADLTLKNDYNDSIFVIAYRKNNVDIMDLLLEYYEKNYIINYSFDNNDSSNNTKTKNKLMIEEEENIENNCDNNVKNDDDDFLEDDRNLISNGKTLLMLACIHENYDMMELLLKHHTDASFKNFEGNTALHFACQARNINAAKLLLRYNSNLVHISNKKEKTPLMIACKLGDNTMVSLLLKYDANINHRDHNGKTPLIMAYNNDNNNGYSKIIDIHVRDTKYGYTAFLWACKHINNHTIEIITKLLDYGANINDVNSLNQNALIIAILNQTNLQNHQPNVSSINLDLINFLIDRGIDVNVFDLDKYTALMLACQRRSKTIVQRLLKAQADKTLLNEEGKTAMDIALEHQFFEIVQLF